MATCDRCGGDVERKDNRGWYRDTCWSCIQDIADEDPSHFEICDDPDCSVCSTS